VVDFPVVPERTALINVDLQNVFVQGDWPAAPEGLAVLGRINRLAAVCRQTGILVIHTCHVLRPDGSNMGVLSELAPLVRDGMIAKGAETAALHPALVVGPRDIVLEKPRFGAFHGTDLELILRSHGVDTVIISGIATNVCCDTTAREATVRDFRVLFLSDGTAASTMGNAAPAELHRATLATLGTVFAQLLTVDETIEKIRGWAHSSVALAPYDRQSPATEAPGARSA
jgi:ureidoacrylate peracid hydrolase